MLSALIKYVIPMVMAIFILALGMAADYFFQFLPRLAEQNSTLERSQTPASMHISQPRTAGDDAAKGNTAGKPTKE